MDNDSIVVLAFGKKRRAEFLTQDEYDAIEKKDSEKLYFIEL